MNADPERKILVGQLFDLYGDLLTGRQKDVVELSCNDDLSLSEIAEECGITRQGVRDALKKAEEQLFFYEERLGLQKKQKQLERTLQEALLALRTLKDGGADTAAVEEKLTQLL